MKQKKDKLLKYISLDKKIFLFFLILFVIALISGTFFQLILNNTDKKLVLEYLNDFFSSIKSDNINYLKTFVNTFLSNSLYIIIVWILGLTIIGIPIILLIYFFKVFVLGFAIGSLIVNYKINGILYSFIYIFPHTLLNVILIILLSVISITFSIKVILAIIKKKKVDFKNIFLKYLIVLIISIIFVLITTLYEVFILPKVFNLLI